jgi:hypothetical protein
LGGIAPDGKEKLPLGALAERFFIPFGILCKNQYLYNFVKTDINLFQII